MRKWEILGVRPVSSSWEVMGFKRIGHNLSNAAACKTACLHKVAGSLA